MKIVIDITEDAFKRHKWRVNSDMCTELDIAVAKGTPLEEVFEDIKAEIEAVTRFGYAYEPIEHGLLMDIIDKHISGKE